MVLVDNLILFLIIAAIYIIVHEAGHFILSLILGLHPKITMNGFHIVVKWKNGKEWQHRLISEAGFGSGMIVACVSYLFNPIWSLYMWIAISLHFLIYPWSSRYVECNDFNLLVSIKKGDE
jgi:hypothetical protein